MSGNEYDIEDVQPKGTVVCLGDVRLSKIAPKPGLVITKHDISRVMFELLELQVHPQARILAAYCYYGSVYLDIEEPQTAAVAERLLIKAFRQGRVDLKVPKYICSVFEHDKRDHAHIYAELG